MIDGVLQKLVITKQTRTLLILREQPLLEWVMAGVLFIVAINAGLLFNLWITAVGALIIGIYMVAWQAQTRIITFDANANTLVVALNTPLRQQIVTQEALHDIIRAYLAKDENGATQIILVRANGDEMGLSVYSRDANPWKETITIAINAVLHEAHKDDEE